MIAKFLDWLFRFFVERKTGVTLTKDEQQKEE